MYEFKWIDVDKLSIIDEENNPKYLTFNDYVENNLDSLLNHKIENIDIKELCEHILDKYQWGNQCEIEYHIEKLYSYIFLFIYLPQIQSYLTKVDISEELSYIENFLKNKDSLNFIKEKSKNAIDLFKIKYEYNYGIKEFVDLPTADILVDTYIDDIIKKYAVNSDLINEYCLD